MESKISPTLVIRKIFGKPVKGVSVRLNKIDDFLFSPRKNVFTGETNQSGKVHFKNIPVSLYVARIEGRKIEAERIINLEKGGEFVLNFPLFIGIFGKKEEVNDDLLKNEYEKNRTDDDNCFLCKKRYKDMSDFFVCKYCNKNFCNEHRIPETHNCWGNPTNPHKGSFVERHSANGSIHTSGK